MNKVNRMNRNKRRVKTLKIKVKKGDVRLDIYEMKNRKMKIDVKFRGSIPKKVKSELRKIAGTY